MTDEGTIESDRDLCARVAAECACTNFRKVSRAVTQLFDGQLEPTGLRSTQFVVLVALAALEPLSVARLSRELVMDPSTVNRNLKPLEKDGLVVKQTSEKGRRVALMLSDKGRVLLNEAMPLWRQAQNHFVSGLGGDVWQDLRTKLADSVRSATSPSEHR
jgi:DNA-binding MarR family transcriptional regulator